MKPLRILYIVTTFPAVTETFIANQIADMIERGHAVTIFAYNPSYDTLTHSIVTDYSMESLTVFHFKNNSTYLKIFIEGFKFLNTHHKKISYKKLFLLLNPFEWKKNKNQRDCYYDLPIFLFHESFDIIHCHFGFNAKKVADCFKSGILLKEKAIVTFHGSDLTPSKIDYCKGLYADVFKFFKAFTVNTNYLKTQLLSVKSDLINVSVLPVGFHSSYIQPFLEEPKKPSKQFRLLFCGRFISLKGPDLALILMDQLLEAGCQNIELHLIGDGPLRNELESYVIKKGLSEIVTFHGVCTQNEVYKIMRQSDVFIYTGIVEPLTGRAETQGLVVQEAQFLELPVVSFDVGGVGLGILPEQSGFLIPSNDLTSFTKKILFLYQNKTARLEMGKRGHDWVKNEYNSSKLGQKLESIYYGC